MSGDNDTPLLEDVNKEVEEFAVVEGTEELGAEEEATSSSFIFQSDSSIFDGSGTPRQNAPPTRHASGTLPPTPTAA